MPPFRQLHTHTHPCRQIRPLQTKPQQHPGRGTGGGAGVEQGCVEQDGVRIRLARLRLAQLCVHAPHHVLAQRSESHVQGLPMRPRDNERCHRVWFCFFRKTRPGPDGCRLRRNQQHKGLCVRRSGGHHSERHWRHTLLCSMTASLWPGCWAACGDPTTSLAQRTRTGPPVTSCRNRRRSTGTMARKRASAFGR
jgi:hypothetical protein